MIYSSEALMSPYGAANHCRRVNETCVLNVIQLRTRLELQLPQQTCEESSSSRSLGTPPTRPTSDAPDAALQDLFHDAELHLGIRTSARSPTN